MSIKNNFNVTQDLRNLIIYDTNPFKDHEVYEDDIKEKAKENLKPFFQELYRIQKSQVGIDDENRDFDLGPEYVNLPEGDLILPRAKRIPKPKPLSKWEKFRKEKGLTPRKKRDRMIWSELAQDWVPRWGPKRYSIYCY